MSSLDVVSISFPYSESHIVGEIFFRETEHLTKVKNYFFGDQLFTARILPI